MGAAVVDIVKILRETQHTPGAYPRHPQTLKWKEFLHKLLVGGLGYAPGVCWKVLRKMHALFPHVCGILHDIFLLVYFLAHGKWLPPGNLGLQQKAAARNKSGMASGPSYALRHTDWQILWLLRGRQPSHQEWPSCLQPHPNTCTLGPENPAPGRRGSHTDYGALRHEPSLLGATSGRKTPEIMEKVDEAAVDLANLGMMKDK